MHIRGSLLRGSKIKLGTDSKWVDSGHSDKNCDSKKEDVLRTTINLGQYGEWLRVSPINVNGSISSSGPNSDSRSFDKNAERDNSNGQERSGLRDKRNEGTLALVNVVKQPEVNNELGGSSMDESRIDPTGGKNSNSFQSLETIPEEARLISSKLVDIDFQHGSIGARGIFVYANSNQGIRQQQWYSLLRHSLTWGDSWFLGGDLNDIIDNQEKQGGSCREEGSFRGFKNFICKLGGVEPVISGSKFTWSNMRKGMDFIEVKLDRFLVSPNWLLNNPNSRVLNISMAFSDHNMLVWESNCTVESHKKRFFFYSRWAKMEGFSEVVKEAWAAPVEGPVLFSMRGRIKNVKKALLSWKGGKNFNALNIINNCKGELDRMEGLGGHRDWDERILAAKARVNWLKEGDRNTRFFQASVRQRRTMNGLQNLVRVDGSRCVGKQDTVEELSGYFDCLFKSSNPLVDNCDLSGIPVSITKDMNKSLTREVSESEIKTALWDMDQHKAPGYDGMSPAFFQTSWPSIKTELCDAVKTFFQKGKMPKHLNHTVITLIPKKKIPQFLPDHRFISLCTVVYRIIAKILANRLKNVLHHCIDHAQSAFIPGRQIIDNVVIANECLHFLNSKRSGKDKFMAIKLDMAKAYDQLEWNFLAKVLNKMGFCACFTSWILACVCSSSFAFNVQGSVLRYVVLTRGLRQGDPLSPYLFVLISEALSNLIKQACQLRLFSGVKIGKFSPLFPTISLLMTLLYFVKLISIMLILFLIFSEIMEMPLWSLRGRYFSVGKNVMKELETM
ncbi:retrotransposon protein [Striga asiatica]|uniref:Retrotransposon protein n=1 Tax=Striga asiatica TaxID=4170 RepID=A0A5A7PZH8_STRAF|nr:retrotransposon protein [Striga asiatica]